MNTLKRICIHWTAGGAKANAVERQHYHFIVEATGDVVKGVHTPEMNIAPLAGKDYAQHCGGGNSNTIGVAVAGRGETITAVSMEALFKLVAELCKQYNIPIDHDTVYTHYEFGVRNPRTSSVGKPDISRIVYSPEVAKLKPHEVGDFIRGKVRWYYNEIK
jgi:N-acetyl-anhydromuramyl-L-alanine amidase AmpD